jgi:hypothetical protein
MFLVKSSNKCSISWTELEFFTLSTTSSSGTRSLQFLWHVNTHFRQHTFSCSLARDNSKGQILELVATLAKQETEIIECQDNLQNIKTYAAIDGKSSLFDFFFNACLGFI